MYTVFITLREKRLIKKETISTLESKSLMCIWMMKSLIVWKSDIKYFFRKKISCNFICYTENLKLSSFPYKEDLELGGFILKKYFKL